jgi:hypothetical protein
MHVRDLVSGALKNRMSVSDPKAVWRYNRGLNLSAPHANEANRPPLKGPRALPVEFV